MSDLSAAAAALGVPEQIAQRSAEARAAATGSTVEAILAAWAGGAPAPVAAETAAPEAPAAAETPPTPATPEVKIEIPESEPDAGAAPASATTRSPIPAHVTMAEASNIPVVVTVPTTGIKERTNFALPKWMAGLFLAVPLFALFALGGAATGECGSATELRTDVVSGEIVNCDGSKFEGSSIGGGGTDFIALGEAVYQGTAVTGVNCAGCHGVGGGGGAGPALNGVLTVFGACTDHIEWVDLATPGFQAAGRGNYGDTNKPVGGFGVMPGFGSSLSSEQLAAVSAFERVRFGGQDPAIALTDCGLAEEPAEDPGTGEPGADGGEAPPGDATSTTLPQGETTP